MNLFKYIFRNIPDVVQNKFTLTFKDADLERLFFHYYTDQYLIHGRICHVLAVVFYSFFGIFDAAIFPESKMVMWYIRYAVVLPVFICGFLYSYSDSYKKYWQFLFSGYVLVTGGGYVFMTAITPVSISSFLYTGIIFCLFFGYAFIRLRVIFSSFAGWLLTIVYIVVVTWRYDSPDAIVLNNLPYIVGINFLGMLIGYSIELAARHNFLLINDFRRIDNELRKSHNLLEERVKERTEELESAIRVHVEDRKERRRLEAQLHQAQKMESIGTLAGGIAHDFNNILSSIIGFTELTLDYVEKGSMIEDNLQEVYTAGNRAKDLVAQILAFARQSEEKVKPIQIDIIVKEVLQFIRSSIPTTIKIRSNIDSDSIIMGNQIQVYQIMMNLLTNAAYAMEENGGVLTVSLKDTVIEKRLGGRNIGLESGEYVEVSVADTGTGIPPDIIDSIFDPYFTTKGPGEGTGMGLAMVHGIVESYSGKITVESTHGKGTTFTIYLPVTRKRKTQRQYMSEQLPTGTERILLVDDEAPIAKMGARNLEGLGYSVTTRTSSVEALELFRSKPNDFDLVISDMTMPNMTGDLLAAEIMTIRSDIPIIICTGYSKRMSEESAEEIGIKAFAYKPIVKADLAKTVRKVLDDAKP